MKTEKIGVIYANDSNIYDLSKGDFHFGKNFDEMSYAMPLKMAKTLLIVINKERKKNDADPAYIIEIPI